jgi:hypothetical protein
VKYLSVFFHVYYIERILEKIKNLEQFDNSSVNARVSSDWLMMKKFFRLLFLEFYQFDNS